MPEDVFNEIVFLINKNQIDELIKNVIVGVMNERWRWRSVEMYD